MTHRIAPFLFALSTAACSPFLDYPEAEVEQGAALCKDERDNDFDGAVDCEDLDCDGSCAEESLAECSDGRDNDGDALTDAADPRCWPLRPPHTERCAEASGVEFIETFDAPLQIGYTFADLSFWPWRTVSFGGSGWIVREEFHASSERSDGLVAFLDNKNAASALIRGLPDLFARSLGALVRQLPFSGTWQDLAFSVSASVPEGAMLRAAIIPMELAPSADAPALGAEAALLSVTIDTSRSQATLTLGVEGALYPVDLPSAPSCEDSECWARVTVTMDPAGFQATLAFPGWSDVTVSAPAPSRSSLPPARLAFWGGTLDAVESVRLDDVRLRVKPEMPCGFASPQIPGPSCRAEDDLRTFGQSVSVTREEAGDYCALVTASRTTGAPELPLPEALTTWSSSDDGETWQSASVLGLARLALPESAMLIGGGIASTQSGLSLVVTYRQEDQVRLGFLDGDSCSSWGEFEPGPLIHGDAEAPSYVANEAEHTIYFTRPPGGIHRALWRLTRDTSAEPELVGELPSSVNEPVSVQRVGQADLVLTYPELAASGNTGLGFLVLDDTGFSRPADAPFAPPPRPDLTGGEGRVAFDDHGVVAGALAFQESGGLLLYAGRSTTGGLRASQQFPPTLTVGTARFAAADRSFPDPPAAADEDPEAEPAGSLLAASDWQLVTTDPDSSTQRYFTTDPPLLHFAGGEPSWSVLELERAIDGDFELEFDLFIASSMSGAVPCSLYVGLGSENAGVFARARSDSSCSGAYSVVPWRGPGGGAEEDTGAACSDSRAVPMGGFQHVVLRREGETLTVSLDLQDGCGAVGHNLEFPEPVEAFTEVRIGFGGEGFEGCSASASGAIEHLTLEVP